jgi:hypothetical protein
MKKIIIFIMSIIIIFQSFFIFNLYKKPINNIQTKIVYRDDDTTQKIFYQATMFLYLQGDKEGNSYILMNDEHTKRLIDGKQLVTKKTLLDIFTKYNKNNGSTLSN